MCFGKQLGTGQPDAPHLHNDGGGEAELLRPRERQPEGRMPDIIHGLPRDYSFIRLGADVSVIS